MSGSIKKRIEILDFWASWCPPCRIMIPVIEELEKEFPKLKFIKVDVDAEQEVARKHGVMSIPTLIIIKNDKEQKRFTGVTSKEVLRKELLGL